MAITCTVTRGFTFATGVDLSSANLNELGEPTVTVPSVTDTTVVLKSFAAVVVLVVAIPEVLRSVCLVISWGSFG